MLKDPNVITRSGLPFVVSAVAALGFLGFAELAVPSLTGKPQLPRAIRPAWAGLGLMQNPAPEVIVYASELPNGALSEFSFRSDPAAAGGKFAVTPNTGGILDPPPEDDPHVTFKVPVQAGVPYRCWIHMKVGTPKGDSQANMLWVQFSDAIDTSNKPVLKIGTKSYLTARGPTQSGWAWVGCDMADSPSSAAMVTFKTAGDVTVRLQAGMEGVGFDQFVLSPARFLTQPPTEAVVKKS